ncbi:MAG: carbohydrate kinase [Tannerella sp.]|jgi:fructokinase|nr:carbohydrate kinase [Tannerella sp.]
MRKVIGIGETILDIIFENEKPQRAIVGGSVLNGMVSLSRLGVPVTFISEVGDDRVGDIVYNFMHENGMITHYIDRFQARKSPVSLAFLGADRNAEYIFHTDYPEKRLNIPFPEINEDDIFVFGSFYALNPLFRKRFLEFLEEARRCKALIYYDPNFRPSHKAEVLSLRASVAENCSYATIVRGSNEDFYHLYEMADMNDVYSEIIRHYCDCFITTHGSDGVNLYTENVCAHFNSKKVNPVSTIGAGDNFNAGIVYGLLKYEVGYRDVPSLTEMDWAKIIQCGIDLSSEVCCSYSNYISSEFAQKYK